MGKITTADLKALREKQGNCCALTGMPFEFLPTTGPKHLRVPFLDHILPLSRGGAHVLSNLRYIAPQANLIRGDRPFEHVEKYEFEDGTVSYRWVVFANTQEELDQLVRNNREREAQGLPARDHLVRPYTGPRRSFQRSS